MPDFSSTATYPVDPIFMLFSWRVSASRSMAAVSTPMRAPSAFVTFCDRMTTFLPVVRLWMALPMERDLPVSTMALK